MEIDPVPPDTYKRPDRVQERVKDMSRARAQPSSWLLSVGLPLALMVLILTVDWIEGPKIALVGVLVVTPMLSAVFGTPVATAGVATVTWFAALGFGFLAADGNAPAQYVRLGILALVGVGSVAACAKRNLIEQQLSQAQQAAADADQARRDANCDWLTGVLNRRGIAAEFAKRTGGSGSVIMLDVDRMKQVNDLFGHHAGDDLLRAVAGRVRACTQADDAVGRWGGDEFVIVTDASREQARMIAQRIRTAVCSQPVRTSVGLIDVGLSIGLAGFAPGEDLDQALVAADARMYHAKRSALGTAVED